MAGTVYLIDTFSLMFQVFHGIPPMTSPAGLPTNAVFGFSRDLITILRDHKPTWLICAMESPGPGVRDSIYAAYKANRTEMPEDLRPQIEMLKEVIQTFNIPLIEHAGWEADDVIATLTRQAVARGDTVRIVTSDKDARQLLGPLVQIYNLRKNTYLDESGLLLDWGVTPDQVVDFQSLVGDAVDNVPGVPLIGPKKAATLLQTYGTLENVLANSEQVKGDKLKQNLKTYADQAHLSRQLVRLNQELPIDFDWETLQNPQPDVAALQDLFRKYGFRRLIEDVQQFAPANIVPARATSSATSTTTPKKPKAKLKGQRSLFDDEDATEEPPLEPGESDTDRLAVDGSHLPDSPLTPVVAAAERSWKTVDTLDEFLQFLELLKRQTRFCVDLETTHVDATRAEIVGWAFSWEGGSGYYLPVRGPAGSALLDPDTVVEAMRPIFSKSGTEIANQNIKYDLTVLSRVNLSIPLDQLGVDPMVGDYLLDSGARSHNLEVLIKKYLGLDSIPISALIGTGKQQKNMIDIAVDKVAEYATEDADLTLRIVDIISDRLKTEGLYDLYWQLERPLIPILAEMEQTGIRVDADELRRQSEALTERLDQTIREIYELAGHEFNIDSPIQLRKVLFDEQKLPVRRKTQTGPSTDQEVLEELALLHPLPAKIMDHRHLSKLKGTYLDALPGLIHPMTGRIHCSFNQVVAATGRLSSSDPNLQNIPIRTMEGRLIRKAFVPKEQGWKLVCADYSQIELRVLAHFCGDPALKQAFEQGVDIHSAVASEVYGVALADVDSNQRRVAKAVNFGVIYGQSPFGLAAVLGIEKDVAAKFIDDYFTKYAGVKRFIDETLQSCHDTGFAKTIMGRRRAIEGIRLQRGPNLSMPERTAVNSVIQGSAADLIKKAMIQISARLKRESHPARMLLQIHDELVFEAPDADVPSLIELVKYEMEHAITLDVPLVVDIATGDNWLGVE
ncbi:DNA polymerase I [Schlesneria paludicola]|uniref:DNA polymerase I n=1 Tax=Schlesneria paludicola TaxID=360056 RepID=UPI00029B4937|nr:DNA polymerase I [Schlesneria paludicola]